MKYCYLIQAIFCFQLAFSNEPSLHFESSKHILDFDVLNSETFVLYHDTKDISLYFNNDTILFKPTIKLTSTFSDILLWELSKKKIVVYLLYQQLDTKTGMPYCSMIKGAIFQDGKLLKESEVMSNNIYTELIKTEELLLIKSDYSIGYFDIHTNSLRESDCLNCIYDYYKKNTVIFHNRDSFFLINTNSLDIKAHKTKSKDNITPLTMGKCYELYSDDEYLYLFKRGKERNKIKNDLGNDVFQLISTQNSVILFDEIGVWLLTISKNNLQLKSMGNYVTDIKAVKDDLYFFIDKEVYKLEI